MNERVQEIRIIDDDGLTLFDRDAQYIVPLYQRAFAWEEKEIVQLIHDIYYMEQDDSQKYYLGSLVVSRNENEYEVIDGQQRLTTLFILLRCLFGKNALERDIADTLRFSCRDRSNYTLRNLTKLVEDDRIEENIRAGRDIVLSEISKRDFSIEKFVELLKKVVLYRIEVPIHTDLNRYFEIMNTRGEQLEQHDILKATLMSFLKEDAEKACFADIWDACSDMTGYVQMHFATSMRKALFGGSWGERPSFERLSDLSGAVQNKTDREVAIADIIKDDFCVELFDGVDDNSDRVRFESIIEFPYFLLHVLRVFVATRSIESKSGNALTDELLDDKKLTRAFERVINNGVMNGYPISEQRDNFSREFIKCLLQCRFLFDKYIIKREYVNEDSDGKWSLKTLWVSKKRAYYKNTYFSRSGEWENTRERRTKNNTMLQACFRVSYTSPKIMHWITELLVWLNENGFANLEHLHEYEAVSENIAKRAVKKDFLDVCGSVEPKRYNLGVNTPHIVFNYLDYLLWKESDEDFTFEFRNSVEHWYPQHPSEGTFEHWSHDEGLDDFGNLCIIQRNINSKFSNLSPESKKSSFEKMIAKGSLKLRRMAQLTVPFEGKRADINWRDNVCKQHEKEMLSKLRTACEE